MKNINRLKEIHSAYIMPTYVAGSMQAKAYRSLSKHFGDTLAPFDVTMAEWALLGSVYDAKQLRLSEIAATLKIKAPLATSMVDKLSQKGLVVRTDDTDDNRVRYVALTKQGAELVPQVEKVGRAFMRGYLGGVERSDLLAYLRVLKVLADK